MSGHAWFRSFGFALMVLVLVALLGHEATSTEDAHAAGQPLWVNDPAYGSAGVGFYWDPTANQVWTAERGWHLFTPAFPEPSSTLWVDALDYGSAGGGFYLDPLSGQVWTRERGWHGYAPDSSGVPLRYPDCYDSLELKGDWSKRRNEVIILHGWQSDSGGDFQRLASAISNYLDQNNRDWGVTDLDWKHQASQEVAGPYPLPPKVSSAQDVGRCLGKFLADNGRYEHLHIIAHSLGSWVADSLVRELQNQGSHVDTFVTLLDAYNGAQYQLGNTSGADLGGSAGHSEHYFHSGYGGKPVVGTALPSFPDAPFTQTALKKGCNFDVEELGPDLPAYVVWRNGKLEWAADSHGFPIGWYTATVKAGLPGWPGFPQSPEYVTQGKKGCDSSQVEKLHYRVGLEPPSADVGTGATITLTAMTNFDVAPSAGGAKIEIREVRDFSPDQVVATCDTSPCGIDVSSSEAATRKYRADVIRPRQLITNHTIVSSRTIEVRWRAATCGSSSPVYLYEHTSFGGRCEGFSTSVSSFSGLTIGNDAASSIKVKSGWHATVFEHTNYGGRSWCFDGDEADFTRYSGLNDAASSMKVESGGCPPPAPSYSGSLTVTGGAGTHRNPGESIQLCFSLTPNPSSAFDYHLFVAPQGVTEYEVTYGSSPAAGDCKQVTLSTTETGRKDYRIEFVIGGGVVARASTYIFVDAPAPANYTATLSPQGGQGSHHNAGTGLQICYTLSPTNVPFSWRLYKRPEGMSESFVTQGNDTGGGDCLDTTLSTSEFGRKDYRVEFMVNNTQVAQASTFIYVDGQPAINFSGTLTPQGGAGSSHAAGSAMQICYTLTPANVPFAFRLYKRPQGQGESLVTQGNDTGGGDCISTTLSTTETGRKDYRMEFVVNNAVVAQASTWITVTGGGGGGGGGSTCTVSTGNYSHLFVSGPCSAAFVGRTITLRGQTVTIVARTQTAGTLVDLTVSPSFTFIALPGEIATIN